VSMSMAAALKAARAVEIARVVVAVELLCAAQAIDLLAPLTTSAPLARVHESIRARVATLDRDRPPSRDIDAITAMIDAGDLDRACPLKVN
jgi:histidine ammonia-lyase